MELLPRQRWLIAAALARTEAAAPCPAPFPPVRHRARGRCSGGRAAGGCACLRTCCRTSGQRRQRSHSCHRPPEPPHGRHQQRPLTVSLSGCHQRGCKAVPEAKLPKDLQKALLMSPQEDAVFSGQRDGACEQGKSEFYSMTRVANEPQHLQEGPAAAVPHVPGAQEASWHKQGDATCERAVSADVENGFCTRDGSVREPLAPQGTAAMGNEHKRNLRRFLGERFRCHPVGTAVLILLLLVLVLALGAALAVLAAPQLPVTPATPLLVLGCPHGWVGYKGVCYYFSRDYSTWDQGQERCSELNASLAIAQDEEAMDLLFRLFGNGDFWLGLRRRGERLHWGDGSSYSSRVPVLGSSQCVYLADETLKSENCSHRRPYVCSKAQAPQ
ncbi:uncharacterized protein LOC128944878 [Melozone crissalis]|uniref:uncharacterized protein LOC128944878 n=1 Tax=Melozone crissalis TaxID=40204 RepID=UPI0023DCD739|nr:uncharacterized protein LOC128944878 [Melozone crissalis]